ncbi:Glutamate racemase [hydrothermal vent metagenome]|uniref:glutamate racemase n=1 Tax=hydrothermal vent metagenome TaxID=652676 RepID=A0A3B1C9D9_9ZZZZ
MSDRRAIGIFDSGLGGLTVLRQIHDLLPREPLVYLGDTARVPYGSKSEKTILKYSENNIGYLEKHDVKMVVVACNTASAYAIPLLEKHRVPIIGVIEGGVEAAVKNSGGAIGVIGTEATINSKAYEFAINRKLPGARVTSKACPLFVPLVEEGWIDSPVTRAVASEYLEKFYEQVDTLVLGCTHYPLLKKTIGQVLGTATILVDSARETALKVKEALREHDLFTDDYMNVGSIEIVVTDSPDRSLRVAKRMLGYRKIEKIGYVDIT